MFVCCFVFGFGFLEIKPWWIQRQTVQCHLHPHWSSFLLESTSGATMASAEEGGSRWRLEDSCSFNHRVDHAGSDGDGWFWKPKSTFVNKRTIGIENEGRGKKREKEKKEEKEASLVTCQRKGNMSWGKQISESRHLPTLERNQREKKRCGYWVCFCFCFLHVFFFFERNEEENEMRWNRKSETWETWFAVIEMMMIRRIRSDYLHKKEKQEKVRSKIEGKRKKFQSTSIIQNHNAEILIVNSVIAPDFHDCDH